MTMHRDPPSFHRVAVYFAPHPDSLQGQAGSTWLGRCALRDAPLPQPAVEGISPQHLADLTAEPRRYGWHGTLKAPFRLGQNVQLADVRAALRRLCEGRPVFELPMQVAALGDFLALRPTHASPALDALAADCVQTLQALADPLSAGELARRRRAGLTPEQDALMQAWGYPHVLSQFRFHLSLTGSLRDLSDPARARLLEAAQQHFQGLASCRIDRLSLFIEPEPGAPFRLFEQMEFSR
ncbi:MAG: hypothetical protein RL522_1127 [Pseudomonadota bacterium]|jgi:putative phosphonate metabolism protein